MSPALRGDLGAELQSEHPCGAVPCTGAGPARMLQPAGTTATLSRPGMVHAGRVGETHGEALRGRGGRACSSQNAATQPPTPACLCCQGAVSLPGAGRGVSHTPLVLVTSGSMLGPR